MGLRMKVSCRGFFQVGIIKTPAQGIFAYFLTCMTSPEVQTTKLLSSLRSTITKLVIIYAKQSKRSRRACLYYANCCACFHLSLIRDIELNPGPKKSQKCQECEQTLKKNQKQINCKSCFDLLHVKCVCLSNNITTTQNNFKRT